ncbi:hypothetical protein ATZ36_17310 [Candidatus Endomicrobiellum trichonymphae]|uniref:Uncharacterized protein n=1 Tax=Endomicrobium trichonymphae TaxID=1408204 RepID=A0A1E5IJY1_ENDTX|nr:hypothetical protein ATZ36_17310 [Candidatus Endomicrobium trichonymphae]
MNSIFPQIFFIFLIVSCNYSMFLMFLRTFKMSRRLYEHNDLRKMLEIELICYGRMPVSFRIFEIA